MRQGTPGLSSRSRPRSPTHLGTPCVPRLDWLRPPRAATALLGRLCDCEQARLASARPAPARARICPRRDPKDRSATCELLQAVHEIMFYSAMSLACLDIRLKAFSMCYFRGQVLNRHQLPMIALTLGTSRHVAALRLYMSNWPIQFHAYTLPLLMCSLCVLLLPGPPTAPLPQWPGWLLSPVR